MANEERTKRDDEQSFFQIVLEQWVWVVTGSVLAASWFVANMFGVTALPMLGAGILLMASIVLAVWKAGQASHNRRKVLAARLKPKLEIVGVQHPIVGDHYRIIVRNLTHRAIRFRAKLIETQPPLRHYSLPANLQPTHCQGMETVGEIGPDDKQPVDVFVFGPVYGVGERHGQLVDGLVVDNRNHAQLKLVGAGTRPYLDRIEIGQRMELRIAVYPVSEAGDSEKRWFYIVSQRDGGVIFTADGSVTFSARNENEVHT